MHRLLRPMAASLLLCATAATAGPIEAGNARLFRVTIEGQATPPAGATNVDIVIPLLTRGACYEVDESSFLLETTVQSGPSRPIARVPHERVVTRQTSRGRVRIVAQLRGAPTGSVRWRAQYDIRTAESLANEAALRRSTWPREWPETVRGALEPSLALESDDALFAQAVQDAMGPDLRMVPPYDAAKTLLNYCIRNFKVLPGPEDEWWSHAGDPNRRRDPDGIDHPDSRVRRLFRHREGSYSSALRAAEYGSGSPSDLVAISVATLRAAGIPARPVIGIWAHKSGTEVPIIWGEFYLQEIGWVPFDADGMEKAKNAAARTVNDPWPGFASVPDLNRFIPLTYGSQLPRTGSREFDRPLADANYVDCRHELRSPDGTHVWPARTRITVVSRGAAPLPSR